MKPSQQLKWQLLKSNILSQPNPDMLIWDLNAEDLQGHMKSLLSPTEPLFP